MDIEEITEKYKDLYKNYNSDKAIATLMHLVAGINVRNEILFKTLQENGINVEQISDVKFTELTNNEIDKILAEIFGKEH